MNRRAGAFALLMGGALFAQDIHLKTRTLTGAVQPEEKIAGRQAVGDTDTSSIHKIIQFDHAPGIEDIDALLRDGIPVVGALPDDAVVVSAPGGRLPPRQGVKWIGRMQAADKLSPQLGLAALNSPDLVTAIVEFHSDVASGQQETVAGAEGLTLQRPAVLRSDHAIITATAAQLRALAAHDEVAYIFPADPALLTDTDLIPCAGMLTVSGMIGQYANIVHGWDLDPDRAAHLGYAFGSVTPRVPALTVKSEVVRALSEWSKYTNIIFQPAAASSSPRTILVKFVSGYHGDAWPFDGPGGILAHTFYPVPVNTESIAGDMHLDADENWHAGGDIDIYSVALHEAGHAIGLSHSDKPGDVMYPYYRSRSALSANDIGAAQALYGVLNASAAPVTVLSAGDPPPVLPPVAAPLSLVLDPVPGSTQASSIAFTGTLSGGKAPYSVQWQSDHGYSGKASIQSYGQVSASWTANGVSLADGVNSITVTAFDSSQKSLTGDLSITLRQSPAASGPSLPVSIKIAAPASAVSIMNAATLTMSGTASGGSGITRVTWQTAAGASGTASGTNYWVAQSIPLLVGTNTVIVRAWDNNGNTAWAALVAVRH